MCVGHDSVVLYSASVRVFVPFVVCVCVSVVDGAFLDEKRTLFVCCTIRNFFVCVCAISCFLLGFYDPFALLCRFCFIGLGFVTFPQELWTDYDEVRRKQNGGTGCYVDWDEFGSDRLWTLLDIKIENK